jgi:hypothetical protein
LAHTSRVAKQCRGETEGGEKSQAQSQVCRAEVIKYRQPSTLAQAPASGATAATESRLHPNFTRQSHPTIPPQTSTLVAPRAHCSALTLSSSTTAASNLLNLSSEKHLSMSLTTIHCPAAVGCLHIRHGQNFPLGLLPSLARHANKQAHRPTP